MVGKTVIEKILSAKAGKDIGPGDIADVFVDCRCARDFGGANVVKNLKENGLKVDDVDRTFFTFDCNPGGSSSAYAENQHICRLFARERGIKVFDIDQGIGTHGAIDKSLVKPGEVFVSTDSHANIMGAIGAFGQGMGDIDIAATMAHGRSWFKAPKSMLVKLIGMPMDPLVSAKDITFALLKEFGANGLLGHCAEVVGEYVETMNVSSRITVSSMATEMGGIAILFTPNANTLKELGLPVDFSITKADEDAKYSKVVEIDISHLVPHVARPGHPDDVVPLKEVVKTKIDSAFIGSCTNGRHEDFVAAAEVLRNRKIAPGVVLKIVPATREIWDQLMKEGILKVFMDCGAMIGNSGCAGCAAGQIGQNGPKEVTVSTGNRNFPGKQGKGQVWLASPTTVAASAIAGYLCFPNDLPEKPSVFEQGIKNAETGTTPAPTAVCEKHDEKTVSGRAWVIDIDNIDTDMIFHNRYLHITDINQMGQYAFDNLEGYKDFAKKCQKHDIIVVGKNFGCGSSRQQAVDCFKALGCSCIVADSYGAIYERNAINAGFPIVVAEGASKTLKNGDTIYVSFETGEIKVDDKVIVKGEEFSATQMDIYKRGGLLCCKAKDW